jgi:peptide/nickel transport system permease protein
LSILPAGLRSPPATVLPMTRFLTRRLLLLVPVTLGVLTLVFSLVHLIPGDPVEIMLGEGASAADMDNLRHQLGLDRPLGVQYWHYLGGLFHADLGTSLSYGEPVTTLIASRLLPTLLLTLASLLVALAIALPAGVLGAVKQNSPGDHLLTVLALLGVSMPNFWLGPLLIILFSIQLGWLPVSGMEGPLSIVLPAITLGTALAAVLTRMIRSSLLEELGEEYVRAARAKGLPENSVLWKHAMRNALIPVLTVIGLQFGSLLTGAIITETIFSWPGLGQLLIRSINYRDFPLVQGCILTISVTYIAVNLLTDLAYAWLDPRIKLS